MKRSLLFASIFLLSLSTHAQKIVEWPAGKGLRGRLELDMRRDSPVIHQLSIIKGPTTTEILRDAEPTFLLRVGKRDLVSQNGWNIFFDKVPLKPYQSYPLTLDKRHLTVLHKKAQTIITVDKIEAPGFSGTLEITLYHGSLLMNIAAVMTTTKDSTAILYDAGLMRRGGSLDSVAWYDVDEKWHSVAAAPYDSLHTAAVKFRAIGSGHLVVFPPPHQYFYPLDEAFNLRFVWCTNHGIGIRQDPQGDLRYVPWFNAPPGTKQRLNFFCLFDNAPLASVMEEVKAYTRADHYKPLPGYKT